MGGLKIKNHKGTWHILDEGVISDGRISKKVIFLEHDVYGEDACLLVDENYNIIPELEGAEGLIDAKNLVSSSSWAELYVNEIWADIVETTAEHLKGQLYFNHDDMSTAEYTLPTEKFYVNENIYYKRYLIHGVQSQFLKLYGLGYGEWVEVGDYELDNTSKLIKEETK